jgi:hypothetical protein
MQRSIREKPEEGVTIRDIEDGGLKTRIAQRLFQSIKAVGVGIGGDDFGYA